MQTTLITNTGQYLANHTVAADGLSNTVHYNHTERNDSDDKLPAAEVQTSFTVRKKKSILKTLALKQTFNLFRLRCS